MSWGGLPFWIYQLMYEHDLAKMSGAFEDEWFSGTSKVMANHAIAISKATFKTWEPGGWNYGYGDTANFKELQSNLYNNCE